MNPYKAIARERFDKVWKSRIRNIAEKVLAANTLQSIERVIRDDVTFFVDFLIDDLTAEVRRETLEEVLTLLAKETFEKTDINSEEGGGLARAHMIVSILRSPDTSPKT